VFLLRLAKWRAPAPTSKAGQAKFILFKIVDVGQALVFSQELLK